MKMQTVRWSYSKADTTWILKQKETSKRYIQDLIIITSTFMNLQKI